MYTKYQVGGPTPDWLQDLDMKARMNLLWGPLLVVCTHMCFACVNARGGPFAPLVSPQRPTPGMKEAIVVVPARENGWVNSHIVSANGSTTVKRFSIPGSRDSANISVWTDLAQLSPGVMQAAAVSVRDGRVVVIGGTDPSTAASRQVKLAQARSLKLGNSTSAGASSAIWRVYDNMPTARDSLTAVALRDGDTVLAIGGSTGNAQTPSGQGTIVISGAVEALSLTTGKWSGGGDWPIMPERHGAW